MRARAAKLGKTLTSFAQDDCHNFAAAFHATVPREIRDQVYGFLVSSSPLLDVPYRKSTLIDERAKWAFPEFVGPQFAREFVQIYYEKMKLVFDESNMENIRALLTTDAIDCGTVPTDHLRFCEVWFKGDCVFNYALLDTGDPHGILAKHTYQLDALLDLKQGSAQITFKIDLCGYIDYYSLRVLVHHLLLLGPLLHRCKEKNLSFKVYVLSHTKEAKDLWRDITSLWDMSLDTLMEKVSVWKETSEIHMTRPRKVPDTKSLPVPAIYDGMEEWAFKNKEDYDMLRNILMGSS